MLVKKVSPHLKRLSKKYAAINRQFFEQPLRKNRCPILTFSDPLEEDKYQVTKGLIHKYPGRVLALLTMTCASYCRFCTRQRMVSDIRKGITNHHDIDKMVNYVLKHEDISEVIFSGGDPLVVPKVLVYAMKEFSKIPHLKIMRIGTRMPVSDPKKVPIATLVRAIKEIKQPIYILIHFEHPAEITPDTIKMINAFKRAGCSILSQSVFLRDVNDNFDTLYELFTRLLEIGVVPYYIYRCDLVTGAENYIGDFKKEIRIMTELRKKLSGLAYPTYIIDTPVGSGKIPVPLNFWQFNKRQYTDFVGKRHKVL